MKQFDLVVRGGSIVDGSGAPAYKGDIAVQDGWIAAVGVVDGKGKTEIDATGKIVTPGFVDVHTHYDGQVIWSERLSPSSDHGVTTVLTGNCGIGFAPCRSKDHTALIELMEGVEDIPEAVTSAGLTWDWETFPEYLNAVESRPHDIDIITLMPHSPLRVYVMGERAIRREEATPEDLERMKQLYAEALDAGALGIGTSRLHVHRSSKGEIIPSFGAEEAELNAFADVMREKNAGVFQLVAGMLEVNFDTEMSLMKRISQRSGRPITYTAAQTPRDPEKWREIGPYLQAASEEGAEMKAQLFPRPVGMIIGLTGSVNPFCLVPAWKEISDLPLAEKVARMRDPEFRRRMIDEKPHNVLLPLNLMARQYDRMFELEGDVPNYEPPQSASISARAAALGVTPEELAYDIMLKKDGAATLLVALANYGEYNLNFMHTMLQDPNVIVGLGDGGAHYGMICDASYPTFMLTHWVQKRDGARFTLEQAVHFMSRKTALAVGLSDRGLLAPGHRAHINVIDLDKLSLSMPHIIHDLPGGGKRLHQSATGYVATIVNGEVIQCNGEPTGAHPGALIRGAQQARAVSADKTSAFAAE